MKNFTLLQECNITINYLSHRVLKAQSPIFFVSSFYWTKNRIKAQSPIFFFVFSFYWTKNLMRGGLGIAVLGEGPPNIIPFLIKCFSHQGNFALSFPKRGMWQNVFPGTPISGVCGKCWGCALQSGGCIPV